MVNKAVDIGLICARLGFDAIKIPRDDPKQLRHSSKRFRDTYARKYSIDLTRDEMMYHSSFEVIRMAATYLECGIPEEDIRPGKELWSIPRGKEQISYTLHKER